MRRVRLTQDMMVGFDLKRRKRGTTGTVVEVNGHLLRVRWDNGSTAFVNKRYVEDATVLDDLIKAFA